MKKSRKIEKLIGTILGMFLLCTTTFAAQETDIKIEVDGKLIVMDQLPVIENGTTLVPVRPIFEALGFNVRWEKQSSKDNRQVNADRYINQETIRFNVQIDNNRMLVDYVDYGEAEPRYVVIDKKFEVPPQVINGNTLIPVRAISEALGCKVEWLENEKMIVIDTTNAKVMPLDDSPQPADIRKAEIKATEEALAKEKAKKQETPVEKEKFVPTPDSTVVIYSDDNKPVVGDTPGHIIKDPSINNADKYAGSYRLGSIGQCAWYAIGRFDEVHGTKMSTYLYIGAVDEWISNASNYDYIQAVTDKTDIRSLSIAIYAPPQGKDVGHAVFIEYVERDTNGNPIYVYITEGNTQS